MSEKSLRNKLIRLAHQKPELREHLLPLVTKRAERLPVYYAVYSEKNRVLYYFGKANDARSALLTANKLANLLNDLKSILENPAPPLEDPLVYIPKIYGKRFTKPLIQMGLDRQYPLKDIVSIRLDDKTIRETKKLKSFDTYFLSSKQMKIFKEFLSEDLL